MDGYDVPSIFPFPDTGSIARTSASPRVDVSFRYSTRVISKRKTRANDNFRWNESRRSRKKSITRKFPSKVVASRGNSNKGKRSRFAQRKRSVRSRSRRTAVRASDYRCVNGKPRSLRLDLSRLGDRKRANGRLANKRSIASRGAKPRT